MSADMLRDGLSWLADQLHDNAGQPIVYRRKTKSCSAVATLGIVDPLLTPEFGGTQIRTIDRVFVVRAGDLKFDGAPIEPLAGDLVEISENGQTNRYRVAPPSKNEPAFAWDQYRLQMSISAKFLETL